MKNYYLNLLIILTLLSACGPKVDLIPAPGKPELNAADVFSQYPSKDISPNIRDIAFIIKPNSNELTNFSYDFQKSGSDEDGCDLFLLNRIPKENELPALAKINGENYSFMNTGNYIDMLRMNTFEFTVSPLRRLVFSKSKKTYLTSQQCQFIANSGGHSHKNNLGHWSRVFVNNTSYSKKIPTEIKKSLSPEKKLEILSYLIYASSDVKVQKAEEELLLESSPIRKNKDKKLQEIFAQFPCYMKKVRRKKTCLLAPPIENEEAILLEIEKTRDCKKFAKRIKTRGRHFRFYGLTEEILANYKQAIVQCNKTQSNYNDILDPIHQSWDDARSIVTNLLEAVNNSNVEAGKEGFDYIVSPEISKSELIIDKTFTKVKSFILVLSSFSALDSGETEYSIENGKIQNAYFSKRYGVKMLNFKIVAEDVTATASLSFSEHKVLGVAFAGDIHLNYKNGIKRKGIIKLEINTLDQ